MTKSSTVILHLRFPQSLLLLQQLLLLLFINFSVVPIDAFANNNNNNNNNIQQQQQQQSQKRSTAAAAAAAAAAVSSSSSSSSSSASSLVRASVWASASVRLIEEDDDSLSLSLSKNDDISNNDSNDKDKDSIIDYSSSRRRWMYQTQQKFATTAAALTVVVALPSSTKAAYGSSVEEEKEDSTTTTTTRNTSTRNTNSNTKIGVVTDKVYVDIAGLGIQSESESSAEISKTQRIVFGLFGDDSPNSVNKIKQLFNSKVGLPAECKPLKKDFLIQREQLEANKVYRSCVEGVESNNNVNYLYSQIWRIIQNDRIDFGSVSGKFISREFPTWNENENKNDNGNEDNNTGGNGESDGFASTAKKITEYTSQPTIHYLMAVRRGNDSGFGFTVFPTENLMNNQDFLDNYIVIGKVCESTDSIIQQINNVSVVSTSKKINYGGIVGGKNKKNAPDKSCRYGGPMYCNENKPLKKLTMFRTGIESMDAVLYL